jgi:transcriptional regulator with XRE-family HTH domain
MINFSRWMDEAGHRDDLVAAAVNVGRTTIWRIRNGTRRPSVRIIEALIRYSIGCVERGEVTWALRPDDFFEIAELSSPPDEAA